MHGFYVKMSRTALILTAIRTWQKFHFSCSCSFIQANFGNAGTHKRVEGHGLNPGQAASLQRMFCSVPLQDSVQEGKDLPMRNHPYTIRFLWSMEWCSRALLIDILIDSFAQAWVYFLNTSEYKIIILDWICGVLTKFFIPILVAIHLASRINLSEQACVGEISLFHLIFRKVQIVICFVKWLGLFKMGVKE